MVAYRRILTTGPLLLCHYGAMNVGYEVVSF